MAHSNTLVRQPRFRKPALRYNNGEGEATTESFNLNLPKQTTLGDINFESEATRLLDSNPQLNTGVNREAIEKESSDFISKNSAASEFKITGDKDGGAGFLDNIDLGELSGYIIPGLDSIISTKQSNDFYKDAVATATPLSLNAGSVTDLAKPNFATPARTPQGSSLAETVGSQKLGDIQQRGQEGNFELENSKSRISQRKDSENIQNQEAISNNADLAKTKQFNNTVAFKRGATKEARAQEALIGLAQNFQSGHAMRGFTKNSQKIQTAQSLIKSGQVKAGMKLLGLDTTGIQDFASNSK